MEKTTKKIKLPQQQGLSVFNSSAFLLLLALLLLSIGSWFAFTQKPRLDVFTPSTLTDTFVYPVEQNAFQRLPRISSNLSDVFVLPNSDLLWVTSFDGFIYHSKDGGYSWQQQYPKLSAESEVIKYSQSTLDWLIKPGLAADKKAIRQIPSSELDLLDKKNDSSKQENTQLKQKASVQTTLQQQAEEPKQNKFLAALVLYDIYFVDTLHGWAVGDRGTILHTSDGGANWQRQNSPADAPLRSVKFINHLQGWVVGGRGTILSTKDSGKTWQKQNLSKNEVLSSVDFVDHQQGWVTSFNGTISHTSNGGESWKDQYSTKDGGFNSVDFINKKQGWAAGPGGIFHTVDGGASWQRQYSGTDRWINSIIFINAQYGWATSNGDTLLKTTNGGKSWQARPLANFNIRIQSIHFNDAKRGWIVGDAGTILYTNDGGLNWTSLSHGHDQWLYSAHFINKQLAWVAGTRGTILHSRDGGTRWEVQASGVNESIRAIQFVDSQQGWAVGGKGTVLHTTNGGQDWQQQESGIKETLFDISFINAREGWAVGMQGVVIKTSNGGINWQRQKKPGKTISTALTAVDFITADNGWTVDSNGRVFRTLDGGVNWETGVKGSATMLRSIEMIDSQSGWATGDGNRLIKTTDGGNSWQAQDIQKRGLYTDVSFIDQQYGWVVGSDRTVLHTANAGSDWQVQTPKTDKTLNSVSFADRQHGITVGEQYTLIHTTDGGKTWHAPQYKKYPAGWYTLFCIAVIVLCWSAYRSPQHQQQTEETITDLLASDRPLQPGDPDPLGFNDIAQGLSRFLRNPRTEPPLTIAVTGEWGSGKSSLMNLLHQDLHDKGFSTVWFNAWHHQKSEQLLASLFANIRTQAIPGSLQFSGLRPVGLIFRLRLLKLRSEKHWLSLLSGVFIISVLATLMLSGNGQLHEIQTWVQHQVDMLSARVNIVTGIVTSLGTATAIMFGLAKSMQGFALNPLRLMTVNGKQGQKSAAVDPGARYQFAQEFGNVTQSLDLGRMIIFIDDLDRCGKENVLEVLEAINFLVSSGDCYIILGMAPEWVKICVGLGFKELAEESYVELNNGVQDERVEHRRQFASQYLEKMINIEVPVPKLDEEKAQLLTVPEFKQVELSAFDQWTRKALQRVQQNRVLLAVSLVVAIGAGVGQTDVFNFSTPSTPKQLIGQWAAHDLQWLKNEQGEPLIATFERPTKQDTPELQWQLKAEHDVLKEGVLIENFADGKLKLYLKEAAEKDKPVAPKKGDHDYNKDPPDPSPGVPEPGVDTEFEPGQVSPTTWHRYIPVGLLMVVLGAALSLFFRKSERIVEDSHSFRKAMRLWQPYLMLRQQSPRKIKRFINHLRYLAMRYRENEAPHTSWQTWRNKDMPVTAAETFSEPSLVALSMLYYLDPTWVKDEHNFTMINQLKISEATTGIQFDAPAEHSKLIQQLQDTVQQHYELFNVETLATPQQRELFLAAQGDVVDQT